MNIVKTKNVKIEKPILIEGLPGIGNVGKIAVDFMIENLKAEKIYEIHSNKYPHAVFVNEKNLIEAPRIDIYYKKIGKKDLMFLVGDIQPIDEEACYTFCNELLDLFKNLKGEEIITLGGIGLQRIPENPQVYCTGNSKKIIQKYKTQRLNQNIYGVVGPIIGVTGLLVGLSMRKKIPAIALLAETLGHPTYLGIKGAREILELLNEKLKLGLDLKQLDEEITEIEKEIKTKTKQMSLLHKSKKVRNIGLHETNYIG